MTIKAVVFDLDGTIVNFNLDYKAARAEAIDYLITHGFPRSLFSLNESVFEMLKKVEITMQNNRKTKKEFNKLKQTLFTILEKHEMQSARTTTLIPGILETLKELKKMKLKLALFTMNSKKSTNYILETFRLKNYFDAVVTRDSVPLVKPNPVHLETALKKLKAKPQEAIVVGDSILDIKSAQQLNATPVAVTYGITQKQKLTQTGAKHLITSPNHLLTIIEKHTQQKQPNPH